MASAGGRAAEALADNSTPSSKTAGSPEEEVCELGALQSVVLSVENMHCGGCMRKVERALAASDGVSNARAHLSAKRVAVSYNPATTDVDKIIATLDNVGFSAAQMVATSNSDDEKLDRFFLSCLGVAAFATMNIMMFSVSVWAGGMDQATRELFHWISALIALPTVAYAGQPFFQSAWRALRKFTLNMDVPISLAILLSTGMSVYQTTRHSDQVYFDASVALLFFLLLGRFLDQRMRTRAKGAAQNLLKMRAQWATVIQEDGTAQRMTADTLIPGMRVAAAAGERFPADGVVVSGESQVDESLLTGESLPRAVTAGNEVHAGTINLGSTIEFMTTKTEGDTLLAELTRLMETAEQARGRYVRLADRASSLYSPAVHILAGATFLSWLFLGAGWETALTISVAVLIITCPCALALAVPAVQVAASSRLFAKGVLIKAPDGLERLSEVDTIVFDKTGTLTHGRPTVLNSVIDLELLKGAAALAATSRHPYAQAVVAAAKQRCGIDAVTRAEGVIEEHGAGLKAVTSFGEERLGSAEWCGITGQLAQDYSLWYVRPGREPLGFKLADTLRIDAVETIRQLKQAGYAIELLSGDREEPVAEAAKELGIDNYRARCKPQDKIARLNELAKQGRKVLMVGDGLNDAPALAAAHASLSPSTAADVSQIASDAVFQGNQLGAIVELLATAWKAQRMAFENFAIAGAYNVIFVPIAALGFVTPLIAAIAMSTSSIFVTANALRLRGRKLNLAAYKHRFGERSQTA